jgi:hypothetical protein
MLPCFETPAARAPQHEVVLLDPVLILRSDFALTRNRVSKDEAAREFE